MNIYVKIRNNRKKEINTQEDIYNNIQIHTNTRNAKSYIFLHARLPEVVVEGCEREEGFVAAGHQPHTDGQADVDQIALTKHTAFVCVYKLI